MTDLIERAERFARVCHAGQCRKGADNAAVTVKINNIDAHFRSGINLLLICRASVFTDLFVGC